MMAGIWSRLGRLLLSWSVLMMLTGAATYGLALVIVSGLPQAADVTLLTVLFFSAAFPAVIAGAIQRLYLKPYWSIPATWMIATGLGWGVGLPLIVFLSASLRGPVADWSIASRLGIFLAAAAFSGLVASFGQWRLLRSVTDRHYWWLLANAVGWLMAWILVLAAGYFIGGGEDLPISLDRAGQALLLGGIAGLVIGFEQGIAIVGLFSQLAWEKMKKTSR